MHAANINIVGRLTRSPIHHCLSLSMLEFELFEVGNMQARYHLALTSLDFDSTGVRPWPRSHMSRRIRCIGKSITVSKRAILNPSQVPRVCKRKGADFAHLRLD